MPLIFELMGDQSGSSSAPHYFDMRWRLEGDVLEMEVVASNDSSAGHSNTAQAQSVLNAIIGGAWTKVE